MHMSKKIEEVLKCVQICACNVKSYYCRISRLHLLSPPINVLLFSFEKTEENFGTLFLTLVLACTNLDPV